MRKALELMLWALMGAVVTFVLFSKPRPAGSKRPTAPTLSPQHTVGNAALTFSPIIAQPELVSLEATLSPPPEPAGAHDASQHHQRLRKVQDLHLPAVFSSPRPPPPPLSPAALSSLSLGSRRQEGCGGDARVLCMFHVFNADHLDGLNSRIKLLTRVLAQPGRCDKVRFYLGRYVDGDVVRGMIPSEFAHVAQVVDTRPSLGPFRERGSRGNTKRRNFVRGYANRWEDTYRSMLHAWQAEGDSVDWVIKVDLDSTLYAENFRRMLTDKGFCQPDKQELLLGHILLFRSSPFAAGAGFALSRAALVKLCEYMNRTLVVEETPERASRTDKECLDIETQSEDYHLGVCLHRAGVTTTPLDSRDSHDGEYFQIYSVTNHYHGKHFDSQFWYWKNKGFTRETANTGSKCCAQWPAVFHKYPDLTFYQKIYEGEGAIGPDGYFDTSRLHLDEILRMEISHRTKEQQSLKRIHFPPPPQPPPPPTKLPPPSGAGGSLHGAAVVESGGTCDVTVGWCEGSHVNSGNPDEPLVQQLATATFTNRTVCLLKLTLNGMLEQPDGKLVMPRWVDVMICLGHFYDPEVLMTRYNAAESSQVKALPAGVTANEWRGNVRWPGGAVMVPHTRGRPFLLAFNFEAFMAKGACFNGRVGKLGPPWNKLKTKLKYDVMVDTKKGQLVDTGCADTPTLYWPISAVNMFNAAARSIYYSADASFQQLVRTQQPTTTPPRKTKFCAFLAGECDKLIYPADAALRSAFFDLMGERYQSCEAIGRCRMSSAARETFTRSRFVGGQSSIELVQPYRFVLSFENMLMPGYISERVPQTLLAGGVPIYFGDVEELANHVNLDRVIACEGFTLAKLRLFRADVGKFNPKEPERRIEAAKAFFRSELEQCVDRVAALDADAAAYDAFVAKPKLPNNSLRGTIFDIHTVAAQLRQVLRDSESYLMDGQPQEEPL